MPINLKEHIRAVPDFPKEGILFYDIGTLLAYGPAWQQVTAELAKFVDEQKPDFLLAIDARGFLIGAAIAAQLGTSLVMARKKGKLPGSTVSHEYKLEYGTDTLEVSKDLMRPNAKVLIIDDLLATGGTAKAALELVKKVGAEVIAAAFIVELDFLHGRERLNLPTHSLVHYDE